VVFLWSKKGEEEEIPVGNDQKRGFSVILWSGKWKFGFFVVREGPFFWFFCGWK